MQIKTLKHLEACLSRAACAAAAAAFTAEHIEHKAVLYYDLRQIYNKLREYQAEVSSGIKILAPLQASKISPSSEVTP